MQELLTSIAQGLVEDPASVTVTVDEPNEVTEPDETFPVGGENAGDNDAAHEQNDPADPEV